MPVHYPHFFHGVVGPVSDARVRGVDDFVGVTRFIDHLFGAALGGACGPRLRKGRAIHGARLRRRQESRALSVRATSRPSGESRARRGAMCDEEARKIGLGKLACRVHLPVSLRQLAGKFWGVRLANSFQKSSNIGLLVGRELGLLLLDFLHTHEMGILREGFGRQPRLSPQPALARRIILFTEVTEESRSFTEWTRCLAPCPRFGPQCAL